MNKPRHISGWCSHYDEPSGCCYQTEKTLENSTWDQECKSDTS